MKGVKGILLMAGQGERFGDPLPKQFHQLGDKWVYQWTLQRLASSGLFEEIFLVCDPEWIDEIEDGYPVVAGGATRQESSYQGLLAAGPTTQIVVIHDAVRPFVSERILRENIEGARLHGAVDTCIASADTIVYAPQGATINSIPHRAHYLQGQTPQSFSYPLILEAHQKSSKKEASDDCQLVLEMGKKVHIVEGDEWNIKITTQKDLMLAKMQLHEQMPSIDPQ
ncbi:MAG: 2-C-methyl-D-erythritol 4-phosphate cytidylyltransferase 1 [Chlamydiae bacterium]|nr:2-C-methyl-D-erythritol 4-phosphate cytidylyltransferase 1 [Chlamydiota bacterium]